MPDPYGFPPAVGPISHKNIKLNPQNLDIHVVYATNGILGRKISVQVITDKTKKRIYRYTRKFKAETASLEVYEKSPHDPTADKEGWVKRKAERLL